MGSDFDRYKELLNDWNKGEKPQASPASSSRAEAPPGPNPSARPAAQEPPRRADLNARPAAPQAQRAKLRPAGGGAQDGRFPKGTILCIDDEEIVVYRRPVAGKSYDMAYTLLADGSVKIDAVDLNTRQVVELGELSAEDLKRLQSEMRWSRDLVARNCRDREDMDRIPEPDVEAGTETSQEPPRSSPAMGGRTTVHENPEAQSDDSVVNNVFRNESASRVVDEEEAPPQPKLRIRRGQCVSIKMGARSWDSIYWGRDKKGSVVAHKTHGHWTLMHLDLNLYKDTMEVMPEADKGLIEEITADLKAKN